MSVIETSQHKDREEEREAEKDKDIIVMIIIKNKLQALMYRFSYIHVHQCNNNNSNKIGYYVRLWKETKASLLHSINSRLLTRHHTYFKMSEWERERSCVHATCYPLQCALMIMKTRKVSVWMKVLCTSTNTVLLCVLFKTVNGTSTQ